MRAIPLCGETGRVVCQQKRLLERPASGQGIRQRSVKSVPGPGRVNHLSGTRRNLQKRAAVPGDRSALSQGYNHFAAVFLRQFGQRAGPGKQERRLVFVWGAVGNLFHCLRGERAHGGRVPDHRFACLGTHVHSELHRFLRYLILQENDV